MLVALVCAEVVLRVADLPRPRTVGFLGPMLGETETYAHDDELFWRLDVDRGSVGSLGMRGPAPPRIEKTPATLRVVCVGDSCTYGAAVRLEETYGMQLEQRLRHAMPRRSVETLLAGVPGYSTHQNRLVFERDVVRYAPDVTVLYCGGWNDYVPAIGASDRARSAAAARLPNASRLWRLIDQALTRPATDAETERYWAEFRAGRAPDGRRVPLAEFVENLASITTSARRVGSLVLVIVPPLATSTLRATPIAADYRAAVIEFARRRGLPCIDAPALFDAFERGLPERDRDPRGEWPCLLDWVHPSVLGHRLIADALFDALVEAGVVTGPTLPAERAPHVIDVEPTAALAGATIRVRGQRFAEASAVDRAFSGPWWLPRVEIVADGELRAEIPFGTPPGRYPIALVGAHGVSSGDVSVEVRPPTMSAAAETIDDGLRVRCACRGAPGWRVAAWFSTALRDPPEPTRFGAFALAADPDGRPRNAPETPFRFEHLTLLRVDGACDGDGAWSHDATLSRDVVAGLPDTVFVQGLLIAPGQTGRATLTDVATIRVR